MSDGADNRESLATTLAEIRACREAITSAEKRIQEASELFAEWVLEQRGTLLETPPGLDGSDDVLLKGDEGRSTVREELFDLVAHDLKEPLRGITYFVQLLFDECGTQLSAEGIDYLSFVQSAARRMSRLLSETSLYSKMRARVFQPEATDLQSLLEALHEEVKEELEEREGQLRLVGKFPVLLLDPLATQEAFRQLIGNAIQYSDGSPDIEVRVEGPRAGHLLVTVRDLGIGIESQFLDEIFELFTRLHTWDQREGTGVGLAICRDVIERQGGRIRAESTPGKGTSIVITLPDTTVLEES